MVFALTSEIGSSLELIFRQRKQPYKSPLVGNRKIGPHSYLSGEIHRSDRSGSALYLHIDGTIAQLIQSLLESHPSPSRSPRNKPNWLSLSCLSLSSPWSCLCNRRNPPRRCRPIRKETASMVYSPCFNESSLPPSPPYGHSSQTSSYQPSSITTRICLGLYVASAFVFTSVLCSKATRKYLHFLAYLIRPLASKRTHKLYLLIRY